jgi:adenosylmethionine-8-amino-7-oxononanoate aminotransferase
MVAIELVQDRNTRAPLPVDSSFGPEIGRIAGHNGALVRCVGNLIILSPPLVSTQAHMDLLVGALEEAFSKVDQRIAA